MPCRRRPADRFAACRDRSNRALRARRTRSASPTSSVPPTNIWKRPSASVSRRFSASVRSSRARGRAVQWFSLQHRELHAGLALARSRVIASSASSRTANTLSACARSIVSGGSTRIVRALTSVPATRTPRSNRYFEAAKPASSRNEFERDQETLAAHVDDEILVSAHGRAQAVEHVGAHIGGSFGQAFFDHDVDRRERRRAGQRIAAEGGRVQERVFEEPREDALVGRRTRRSASRRRRAPSPGTGCRARRPSVRRRTSCPCGPCRSALRRGSATRRTRRRVCGPRADNRRAGC